jgi:hypothetical protein
MSQLTSPPDPVSSSYGDRAKQIPTQIATAPAGPPKVQCFSEQAFSTAPGGKTVSRQMDSTRGTDGSNPSSSSRESVSRPHALSKVQNPGFRRGCARLAWRLGRQRRAGCFDTAATGGNISVGPYSSTAVPVTVVGENTMPAPTKSGLLRGQRAVDRRSLNSDRVQPKPSTIR